MWTITKLFLESNIFFIIYLLCMQNEREPSYYELVRNPSGQEEIYGRSWIKEKFHTLVKSKQSNVDKVKKN